MKHYIKILLIPALVLSLGAGRATAGDDKAWAAVGGFVGGVITANIFDHHRDHHRTEVIVVERDSHPHKSYRHGHKKHRCESDCDHYAPRGHYETITVREWVPGCWRIEYNRCGDRIRYWEPGYYTHVSKRIWVEDDHRAYAYGRY